VTRTPAIVASTGGDNSLVTDHADRTRGEESLRPISGSVAAFSRFSALASPCSERSPATGTAATTGTRAWASEVTSNRVRDEAVHHLLSAQRPKSPRGGCGSPRRALTGSPPGPSRPSMPRPWRRMPSGPVRMNSWSTLPTAPLHGLHTVSCRICSSPKVPTCVKWATRVADSSGRSHGHADAAVPCG